MSADPIVIVGYARTPMGGFQGVLSSLKATELGSPAVRAAIERSGIVGSPDDQINVNGGATALGHPVGASGARVIATLLAALERLGGRRGVASLCIGGGEATAMAF